MNKLLVLAAVAVSLVVSRASSAYPIWSFHGTESYTSAQLTGTCSFVGAGNCSFSIDGGPAVFTIEPSSSAYTATSTDFTLDTQSASDPNSVFTINPALIVASGYMGVLLTLHDDQGVALAGAPDSTPLLSLLELASIQFSLPTQPAPGSPCPSCGGVISRIFTLDALVPEPVPAALALVGLSCLALMRRLVATRP